MTEKHKEYTVFMTVELECTVEDATSEKDAINQARVFFPKVLDCDKCYYETQSKDAWI